MNFLQELTQFVFSKEILLIFIGAILGYFFIIVMEYIRLPSLTLSINYPNPSDTFFNGNGKPLLPVKSIQIKVSNNRLDNIFLKWWLERYPARGCHGHIIFYDNNGKIIFNTPMETRWVRSPQPIPISGTCCGNQIVIYDLERLNPWLHMDILPGESENIDVAVREEQKDEGYGFCNESYTKGLFNPERILNKGKYFIEIEIISSTRIVRKKFYLINDGKNGKFELNDFPN